MESDLVMLSTKLPDEFKISNLPQKWRPTSFKSTPCHTSYPACSLQGGNCGAISVDSAQAERQSYGVWGDCKSHTTHKKFVSDSNGTVRKGRV